MVTRALLGSLITGPVRTHEVPALRERLTSVYAAMETARAEDAEALRIEANRIDSLLREYDRWHARNDSSFSTKE